jgi:hypothetical protein
MAEVGRYNAAIVSIRAVNETITQDAPITTQKPETKHEEIVIDDEKSKEVDAVLESIEDIISGVNPSKPQEIVVENPSVPTKPVSNPKKEKPPPRSRKTVEKTVANKQ